MNRLELAGQWKRLIDGRQIDNVPVPLSYAPLGQCTLERDFSLPWPVESGWRYFFVTEGVLSTAKFVLNGHELGQAGPWTTHRFEIDPSLLGGQNSLQAHIRDMIEPFGPAPGRRFDGGLIRPIWIERRPETFLADFVLRYRLENDLSASLASVTTHTLERGL